MADRAWVPYTRIAIAPRYFNPPVDVQSELVPGLLNNQCIKVITENGMRKCVKAQYDVANKRIVSLLGGKDVDYAHELGHGMQYQLQKPYGRDLELEAELLAHAQKTIPQRYGGTRQTYEEIEAELFGRRATQNAQDPELWDHPIYREYFKHPKAREYFLRRAYPWIPQVGPVPENRGLLAPVFDWLTRTEGEIMSNPLPSE